MSIRVSIIIPSYRRWHCLPETVRSVAAALSEDCELIVVDQTPDRPVDGERQLRDAAGGANLVFETLAVPSEPRARNHGLRIAQGEFVIYVDDDVLVSPDFVESHLHYYQDSTVWAVAGHAVGRHGNPYYRPRGADGASIHRMVGVNISFRRTVLQRLNGFDERLYTFGDRDIGRRIVLAGGRIANGSKSLLIHLAEESGGCKNRSRTKEWYFRAYHDQIYMLLKERPGTAALLAPRKAWQILRYSSPGWRELLRPNFWLSVAVPALKAARRTAISSRRESEQGFSDPPRPERQIAPM